MRMFVPGSNSASGSRKYEKDPDLEWQRTENWSLWRGPEGSDLCGGVPWWDEVEYAESRCERSRVDLGTAVRAPLSELGVQEGNENGCDDQHNNEGRGEGYHGSGHGRLRTRRLAMGIAMKGGN